MLRSTTLPRLTEVQPSGARPQQDVGLIHGIQPYAKVLWLLHTSPSWI